MSSKPEFKAAYLRSMQPVIDLLNNRFTRTKLKESPLSTYTGANESEIQEMFDEVLQIDTTLQADKLVKKNRKRLKAGSHL